ncbi:type IV secretion system protein [Fusobacterium periodonticum]|uniref:type IV secretion system protein n=1 Tax=Fusobacterium periodonticum TaxID=860 RepID=UPI0028D6F319|nr:type IV secretion system protein [Fusobacterium periodonticum]
MFGLDASAILMMAKSYSEMMIKNLNPTVMSLLGSFLTIDLVLSFLFDESDGLNIFIKLMKKILYYGFFIWIIQDYSKIVFEYLMGGAIQLGNVAAGKGASTEISMDLISKFGLDIGDLVGSFAMGAGALALDFAGIESGTTILLAGVMGYLLFFMMLYIQILVVFVKFYLIAGYAFLLMPFGVFEKTKDITLKALNGLFSQAIEIYVLVVILNLAGDYIDGTFHETIGKALDGYDAIKEGIFTKWAILIFLFLLINKAGSIASSLLAGAIASVGIGAEAGARGFNNAMSTGSRLGGNMANNASTKDKDDTNGYTGGAKAFRKESPAARAYQKAASFMKGKFSKNSGK